MPDMPEMRYIELLAPAKNAEVGRVAIDAGADAVYIGGPAFGARKAAGNSLDDIAGLCRYAHLFGVRVFTTLNTLLRDEELEEAVRLALSYREIGVDAILIQDLRLARILFDMGGFEHMLHASTQCDVRNLERVQELEAMGFSQVVLARELSYAEMRHIREHTTVPLEAFVHGALCVSYSGACYLSEAVCGRSANRGECAQMCRLPYDVLDENGHEILHQKHILSLRDLDRSHHLRELLDCGITTLKIEGRLKDADYVRNVVAYYRQQLDSIFAEDPLYVRSSHGMTRIQFTPDPAKTFHRGETEYFSFFSQGDTPDKRPAHLVNSDTPKSTGEFLGYTPITEAMSLHNGDGLVVGDQGFYWPSKLRFPADLPVYRTYNAEFQRQLAAKDATRRVLPVKIVFNETPEGFEVEISLISLIGPISPIGLISPISLAFEAEKVPATNAERAEAVVRQQLAKLGDTPFEATEVEIHWSQPYFLPASVLNAWRREAVDALMKELEKSGAPDVNKQFTHLHTYKFTNSTSAALPAELMTCKYCILHELGCCKRLHPKKAGFPTFLRRDNLLLRIETDCKNCIMKLTKACLD